MAVLDLLRSTADCGEDLKIYCDSKYVINACTKWLPGWKRRGWKKADGKDVLNKDLLASLDEELRGRAVEFEWVKGHSDHELNEAADERARAVATAYQKGTPVPEGPGFGPAGPPEPPRSAPGPWQPPTRMPRPSPKAPDPSPRGRPRPPVRHRRSRRSPPGARRTRPSSPAVCPPPWQMNSSPGRVPATSTPSNFWPIS